MGENCSFNALRRTGVAIAGGAGGAATTTVSLCSTVLLLFDASRGLAGMGTETAAAGCWRETAGCCC
jgi:hypothetical protein